MLAFTDTNSTSQRIASNDVDAFRAVLSGAKHIVVLAGQNPVPASEISVAPTSEPNAAHLALARFAVPHFRRTVTTRDSSFTIVTQNDEGCERRAIERVFPKFGLSSPFSSSANGPLLPQKDPVLVEACDFDSDSSINAEDLVAKPLADAERANIEAERSHDNSALRGILSKADVCVIIDWRGPPVSSVLDDLIRQMRHRNGIIAAVGDVDRRYLSEVAFHPQGPSCDVVAQMFSIGPNSRVLENGSIQTHHPGMTVTASASGRSVSSGDIRPLPGNTIPLFSKSYVALRPPIKPRPPISEEELHALTNDEIVQLCKTSPSLTDTQLGRELMLQPVYLLASNVLVKVGSATQVRECEARIQTLVREHTTIPVPAVYRFFQHAETSKAYLVMEYVPGDTLDTCWNDLSNWHKLRIAFTLRTYVRQLRRIRTPQIQQQVPGPLTADPFHPLPCSTPALGEYPVGPFTSQPHLRDWMNGRFRVAEYLSGRRIAVPAFDDAAPLVLVHGDLCLRNVILGADGRLWLIDFGCAGVYPPWFEAYGARDDGIFRPPKLWTAARKIAVGEWDAQERFARVCQRALSDGLGIEDPGENWDASDGPGPLGR